MSDIGDIALFTSLGEASRKRHAPALAWRTYRQNELVIDIDDTSTDVLFVVSGLVRVIHRAENGKQVILGELGPGTVFGEMAAIDGVPRSASVTTLEPTRLATMPASAFMDILATEPDVSRFVLTMLTRRIRTLNR